MHDSMSNTRDQRAQVESYLTNALPDCDVTSEVVARGYGPSLFMRTTTRMTVFAFAGEDARISFEAQYGGFKRYYAEHRASLDALDIAFVLCVAPGVPNLDEFRSEVETDVLFCRKFVVVLTDAPDRGLEGLPFLPLMREPRYDKRPPSATAFMQHFGVPAALAGYLAVPHRRSAAAIVEECISQGPTWIPRLTSTRQGDLVPREEHAVERVRLEGISIRSFRAYRKQRDLKLGSRITVLYGPNGFGKTSVFDAIDFAATGGIGHLGLERRARRFRRAVAHLDGRPEEAAVCLRFTSGDEHRELRRRVVSRTQASLDDGRCDRKTALRELTGASPERSERIEYLVSLFRATHFFGQEHQELARDFGRACTLPSHVVARLLAFEDYANARNKAAAVSGILGDRLAHTGQRIREVTSKLKEARRVLRDLEQGENGMANEAVPKTAIARLRRHMQNAGLSVASDEDDRAVVQNCRARMELESAASEARLRRLNRLARQVRRLPRISRTLAQLVKKRHTAEEKMTAAMETRLKVRKEHRDAAERRKVLRAKRGAVNERLEALRWVSAMQTPYEELLRRERKSVAAATEAKEAQDRIRERLSAAMKRVSLADRRRTQLTEDAAKQTRVIRDLTDLEGSQEQWHSNRVRLRRLKQEEQLVRGRLDELTRESSRLSNRLQQSAGERERMERLIATTEAHQLEHSRFLARLVDRVQDGQCPVCGHDHGSRNQLVVRMENERRRDSAAELRQELAHVLEEREKVKSLLAEVQYAIEKEESTLEGLKQAQTECAGAIAEFETAVGKYGVELDNKKQAAERLRTRRSRELARTRELEAQRVEGEEELNDAKREAETLEREFKSLERAIGVAEHETRNLRHEVTQIRDDYRYSRVSFKENPEHLQRLETTEATDIQKIDSALVEAGAEEAANREAERLHDRLVTELKAALTEVEERIGTGEQAVAEAHAGLVECGLGQESDEAAVIARIQEETRRKEHWERLRDLAESAEIALDSAAVAALERRQHRLIQQTEKVLRNAEQDKQSYLFWQTYFREVEARLTVRQNTAIGDFANDYGPMASVVQQRLRSVYGFEGIDTQSYQTTIRVMVKRGEETLRPTDYFSQAQLRTLLLGLFLTARIAQTWSAFSAILLDDPIAHFDDVNTYAFLDMMGSLTGVEHRAPQVILSTCDRRVFRLARSKFRHFGSDAVFYAFRGIGADGPIVEEVPV